MTIKFIVSHDRACRFPLHFFKEKKIQKSTNVCVWFMLVKVIRNIEFDNRSPRFLAVLINIHVLFMYIMLNILWYVHYKIFFYNYNWCWFQGFHLHHQSQVCYLSAECLLNASQLPTRWHSQTLGTVMNLFCPLKRKKIFV